MSTKSSFFRGNLVFLFAVAFLSGAILKNAIGSHIRIGFEDPETRIAVGSLVDIDVLEQSLIQKGLPGEISESEVVDTNTSDNQ
jgi:hypothetical protein